MTIKLSGQNVWVVIHKDRHFGVVVDVYGEDEWDILTLQAKFREVAKHHAADGEVLNEDCETTRDPQGNNFEGWEWEITYSPEGDSITVQRNIIHTPD